MEIDQEFFRDPPLDNILLYSKGSLSPSKETIKANLQNVDLIRKQRAANAGLKEEETPEAGQSDSESWSTTMDESDTLGGSLRGSKNAELAYAGIFLIVASAFIWVYLKANLHQSLYYDNKIHNFDYCLEKSVWEDEICHSNTKEDGNQFESREDSNSWTYYLDGLHSFISEKRPIDGKGEIRYPDGAVYTGFFVDGVRMGLGILELPNGDKFEGQWVDDKMQGQGTYTYAKGGSYSGLWAGGKKQGFGVFTYLNGDEYEGSFQNDHMNGHGSFSYVDGGIFIGNLVDDLRQGYGELTFPSQGTYEGEWDNDKKSGQGTQLYTDGRIYVGSWRDDLRHGFGMLLWPNGDKYEGIFEYDNLGKGEWTLE